MTLALELLALLLAQDQAPAKAGLERTVTAKDGEAVAIHLRISEEGKSFPTAIILPEGVAHILSAWDPKNLSLEHEGSRLFATLLAKAEGYLDLVTVSGIHVRLRLEAGAPGAAVDSAVRIQFALPKDVEEVKPARPPAAPGALDLIRAMRLGLVPADATVRTGKNEVLFRGAEIEVSLQYVYETGRYRGYVLGLSNFSGTSAYHLDPSRFGGENLVVVGAKDVVVLPGKATKLYVVDGK